jgi:hypothetical protein
MHPTANTTVVKYLLKRGAAGDAWRYTAKFLVTMVYCGYFFKLKY